MNVDISPNFPPSSSWTAAAARSGSDRCGESWNDLLVVVGGELEGMTPTPAVPPSTRTYPRTLAANEFRIGGHGSSARGDATIGFSRRGRPQGPQRRRELGGGRRRDRAGRDRRQARPRRRDRDRARSEERGVNERKRRIGE